ncbi:MAG: hypothetical protein H7Z13_15020 [Ferruginibacter sp.]|nr:hypothetical protein [Ferruginibacter sp.]
MNYKKFPLFALLIIPFSMLAQKPLAELQFVSIHPNPIIGKGHNGAKDVKFGFEGGTAHKVNGVYYLFTTEVVDTPKTAAVRMAIWSSKDGIRFEKKGIIAETNRNWWDTTHRMSPWSPMAVFDVERNVWSVFNVGYRRKPNATNVYNMTGRILRHDSKVKGRNGIAGPYTEGGWLDVDKKPDWWEGPGEFVSFFPFRVGKSWWAFYGSNSVPEHVEAAATINPNAKNVFYNGLMKSENGLTGKWIRQPELNPLKMDPEFVENCIAAKIAPDLYIAVYDGANEQEISYSCSKDGFHWGKEQLIKIKNAPGWIKNTRTPLCLIREGKDLYTIYFTAFDGNNPDKVEPLWHDGFGNVGMMKVRLAIK